MTEYERLGYLPDAMVNFLGLLGWSPGGNRELMSRDEMIAAFYARRHQRRRRGVRSGKARLVQRAVPCAADAGDLVARVKPLLQAAGLWDGAITTSDRREWLQRVLRLVLPRVQRLPDFVEQARPFLTASRRLRSGGGAEAPDAGRSLDRRIIEALDRWRSERLMPAPSTKPTIERVLRGVADARGIKAAALIHAARIAATGKAVSPGIFEVLALLGKPLTLSRLRDLHAYLQQRV